MIFVDASALVAIILGEPSADSLLSRLERGDESFTNPVAIYEATVNLARKTNGSLADAAFEVRMLLLEVRIRPLPIEAQEYESAIGAFERFGKGRHPAKLNLGDCFAYASAKSRNASILFVGDDFSQTDLPNALADPA